MESMRVDDMLRSAIDYIEKSKRDAVVQEIEQVCGVKNTRLALMEILWWLEYMHRGGRSTESWPVRRGGLATALMCVLKIEKCFGTIFA
jgi:hypothetical protein